MKKTGAAAASAGSMKKFPRITDYLQTRHKPVYEIIENLAMHGSLSPRRGGGVTFLLPDAALIKKLDKMLSSDNPEEATDIISSMIIPMYLKNLNDFVANKDNIPTLIGKRLVVLPASSSREVKLEGGATVTEQAGKDKFVPFASVGPATRGNMAVYVLSGEVDYKKAPEAGFSRNRGKENKDVEGGAAKKRRKRGGAEGANQQEVDDFVQEVVRREHASIRDCAPGQKRESPMLRAVVLQLEKWKSDSPANFEKAKAILSLHPIISFFLIYKNRLYFPWGELNVFAYDKLSGRPGAVQELASYMDEKVGDSAILNSPREVKEAVSDLKSRLGTSVALPGKIREVYANIDSSNKIGRISNVYPASVHNLFSAHPGLHQLIDEFRHYMYRAIKNMNGCKDSDAEASQFNELVVGVNCFRSLVHPEKTIMDIKDELDPKSVTQIQEPFVQGYMLFVPCAKHDLKSEYAYTGGDDDDEEGADPEAELAESASMTIEERSNGNDSENDEDDLADAVLVYIRKHGKLPGKADEEFECTKRED
jgi:hypothetical protein